MRPRRSVRFAPMPGLLEELRRGRPIVLVDDEDRENEGDLVVAAQHVTSGGSPTPRRARRSPCGRVT